MDELVKDKKSSIHRKLRINNINSYREFKDIFFKDYQISLNENFLHELNLDGKLPNGYWTEDRIQVAAETCKTKKEFSDKYNSAYTIARRKKIIEKVCFHMEELRKNWTEDMFLEEAKNHETITSFQKNSKGAFKAAKRRGMLEECYKHMKELTGVSTSYEEEFCREVLERSTGEKFSKVKRFPNLNLEFDGYNAKLKFAFEYNGEQHYDFLKYFHSSFNDFLKQIERDERKMIFCKENNILFLEIPFFVKNKKKYILNFLEENNVCIENKEFKIKVPELSSRKKWTREKIQEKINECETVDEFRKKYPGGYSAALKLHDYEKISRNLVRQKGSKRRHTKEKCQEEALKYDRRVDFYYGSNKEYNAALKYGWIDEICSHMKEKKSFQRGYWTKEKISKAASECETKKEFKDKEEYAYKKALEIEKSEPGFLAKIFSHMKKDPKERRTGLSDRDFLNLASEFNLRSECKEQDRGAYQKLIKLRNMGKYSKKIKQIEKKWDENKKYK